MIRSIDTLKILYVEDEEGIRNSVTRSLSIIGFDVESAVDGVDGLAKFDLEVYDIIITDIRMPNMDGLEMIEKIRQKDMNIPIIITSAFNDFEYLQRAIELKVEKFINKPIHIDELIELINTIKNNIEIKRSLLLGELELKHYKEAIDKTSYVLRVSSQGNILAINDEMKKLLENVFSSVPEKLVLEALFLKEDIESIFSYTNKLQVFHKTTILHCEKNYYTVVLTAFASLLNFEKVEEVTILLNDISLFADQQQETILKLYTDELTGLPNRQKLIYDMQIQADKKHAVAIFDIEGFSHINYLYGYSIGDQVLLSITKLFQEFCHHDENIKLYRINADQFACTFLQDLYFEPDVIKARVVEFINAVEEKELIFEDMHIYVSMTAGIGCYQGDDVFNEASMSLKIAKNRKVPVLCYQDILDIKDQFNLNIIINKKIKKALDAETVVNYYQPIVDKNGKIVKYESLIRIIDNEDTKVLEPSEFLHIAKQSKYYPILTQRVIKNLFNDHGDSDVEISLNLSYDDIINPMVLIMLENQLKAYPKTHLTIELLESESIKDIRKTIDFCVRMKNLGVKIAIDDFGSGYSNFTHLFDLPLDIIKIDGSLVRRVFEVQGYVLLKMIADFAKQLNVETVAEYVEDEMVFEKLKSLDIDMYQGYYFSRPLPLSSLG